MNFNNLLLSVLILSLNLAGSSAFAESIKCTDGDSKVILTFGSEKPYFKYEYFEFGKQHSFESLPVNKWALIHSHISSVADGDEYQLNVEIASGDSTPMCVPVPGTRACKGYEPGVGVETVASVKLKVLGQGIATLNDISIFHSGSYGLSNFVGKKCELATNL